MKYYYQEGEKIFLTNSTTILTEIPPAVYYIKKGLTGLHLERTEDFVLPEKLYGNVSLNAERVINTFLNRKGSLGVLLSGEKGSGKTLTAKIIANSLQAQGISTVLITEMHEQTHIDSFLDSLPDNLVVLFDEFEKVYPNREAQGQVLSYLDGISSRKRLNILSVNETYINHNLINRPGRIFYHFQHGKLKEDTIREYAKEKLANQDFTDELLLVSTLCRGLNFDMLQAIVEESNRYNQKPLELLEILNIEADDHRSYHLEVIEKKTKEVIYTHPSYTVDLLDEDLEVECYFRKTGSAGHNSTFFFFEHITEFDLVKNTARLENEDFIANLRPKKVSENLRFLDHPYVLNSSFAGYP